MSETTTTFEKPARRALFLDRDGVINVEKNYVHRAKDFEFTNGIFDLCRAAREAGMALVVVTNQAGIGRGYYTEASFHALTEWMNDRFSSEGIQIDKVYFCPFHAQHGVRHYRAESFDRKPNPGMLLTAARELNLDLACSVMIGDKCSDVLAARAAGVGISVLLGNEDASCTPDLRVSSLAEAQKALFPEFSAG